LDYHDTVAKIMVASNGALDLSDYFQPWNYIQLAEGDVEFGSGGVMALPDQPGPHTHLLLAGGKQGTIYLLNRDNMGKNILSSNTNATADTQIVEEIVGLIPGGKNYGPGIYSTPAYFDSKVFYCAAGDVLREIPVVNGLLSIDAMTTTNQEVVHEGATASISADGTSNGIVWIADPSAYSYSWSYPNINILSNGPAVLYAYNTDNLSEPLYASNAQTASDDAGDATKFAVPTVTHGKVFLGTQTEVSVYGLKSASTGSSSSGGTGTPDVHSGALDDRAPASMPRSNLLSRRTGPAMWFGPGPNGKGKVTGALPELSCGMAADSDQ
jgi:hypothetical protein